MRPGNRRAAEELAIRILGLQWINMRMREVKFSELGVVDQVASERWARICGLSKVAFQAGTEIGPTWPVEPE